MHERVIGDLVSPTVVLVLGRELAVGQQVSNLEVRRLLRELLDRIAAIPQNALVAVDEGNGTAARGGIDEAGVVNGKPGGVFSLADLADVVCPDGAVGDGYVVFLAGAVVSDGQALAGRGGMCAA